MISVIIPFRNDFEIINPVVNNLLVGAQGKPLEVIVVNDGSVYPSNRFRPLELTHVAVRVINVPISHGVGWCFDRGVEEAKGDSLILMGADVFPPLSYDWHSRVEFLCHTRDTIWCFPTLGINGVADYFGDGVVRYGAKLLITVNVDDLPKSSKIREKLPNYTSIFDGQWNRNGCETYGTREVQCLMGAFYCTTKEFYQKIGGWDTEVNNRFIGHRSWGSLEPYISLKAWLSGGQVALDDSFCVPHLFGRIDKRSRFEKGARSGEVMWWNKLFMLETMVHDASMKKRIYDFINPTKNYHEGRAAIRHYSANVEKVRDRNKELFVRDLAWFCDTFDVKIK